MSDTDERADEILEYLRELTSRIDYADREREAFTEALRPLLRNSSIAAPTGGVDELWLCPCGAHLGLYDPSTEQLRIKTKDLYLTMVVGVGGYVQTNCRKCARTVTLKYEPPAVSKG